MANISHRALPPIFCTGGAGGGFCFFFIGGQVLSVVKAGLQHFFALWTFSDRGQS